MTFTLDSAAAEAAITPECMTFTTRRGGRAAPGFTVNGLFYDQPTRGCSTLLERKDLETRTHPARD